MDTGNWTMPCRMLNLYPGILYLVHKKQKSQTYSWHKFILLKDFFNNNKNPLFWSVWLFLLYKKYFFSALLFLKCFLTRQFFEFSFIVVLFVSKLVCSLFSNSCPIFVYEVCFFLFLLAFYFTPYITTKHNNSNGMRHKTV